MAHPFNNSSYASSSSCRSASALPAPDSLSLSVPVQFPRSSSDCRAAGAYRRARGDFVDFSSAAAAPIDDVPMAKKSDFENKLKSGSKDLFEIVINDGDVDINQEDYKASEIVIEKACKANDAETLARILYLSFQQQQAVSKRYHDHSISAECVFLNLTTEKITQNLQKSDRAFAQRLFLQLNALMEPGAHANEDVQDTFFQLALFADNPDYFAAPERHYDPTLYIRKANQLDSCHVKDVLHKRIFDQNPSPLRKEEICVEVVNDDKLLLLRLLSSEPLFNKRAKTTKVETHASAKQEKVFIYSLVMEGEWHILERLYLDDIFSRATLREICLKDNLSDKIRRTLQKRLLLKFKRENRLSKDGHVYRWKRKKVRMKNPYQKT